MAAIYDNGKCTTHLINYLNVIYKIYPSIDDYEDTVIANYGYSSLYDYQETLKHHQDRRASLKNMLSELTDLACYRAPLYCYITRAGGVYAVNIVLNENASSLAKEEDVVIKMIEAALLDKLNTNRISGWIDDIDSIKKVMPTIRKAHTETMLGYV
jgi:wobble nucleotide-excising tRNase